MSKICGREDMSVEGEMNQWKKCLFCDREGQSSDPQHLSKSKIGVRHLGAYRWLFHIEMAIDGCFI